MRLRKGCGAVIVAAFALGGLVVSSPTHAQVDGRPRRPRLDRRRGRGRRARSAGPSRSPASWPRPIPSSSAEPTPARSTWSSSSTTTRPRATPATSPACRQPAPASPGTDLTGESPAEQAYAQYTGEIDSQFRAEVAAQVPDASAGREPDDGVRRRRHAPAGQPDRQRCCSSPNVAAVQADELRQPETDSSTSFIGAPTIWNQEGGQALAGKGVDLRRPRHRACGPSIPRSPTTRHSATPRRRATVSRAMCDFGDNPLTPAADVFQCNHKLIGGQPFLETYNPLVGGETFADSARDSDGHGTHTTSTAAGNIVTGRHDLRHRSWHRSAASRPARASWSTRSAAPRAASRSDTAAAVQQAILDGADVINFSISGGANPFTDPVELAFLDAYQAGVTVAASAGNSGPGAGTTDHRSPWVITVAASTQTRAFQSTLTLTDGSATQTFVGSSLTKGVPTADAGRPGSSDRRRRHRVVCGNALPAGSVTGKIVACARGGGIGRIQKGCQRPGRRGSRHDPVQPDAAGHRDRQPLPADRPPRRRHDSSWRSWPPIRVPPPRSPTASRRRARAT